MYFLFSSSRKWLLLIFYCLTKTSAFAQSQSIQDSLLSIVNSESEPIPRIEAYHELAWIYRKENPEKAYEFAAKGIEEALLIMDNGRMSIGYVRLAEIDRLRRRYVEANESFQQSLLLEKAIGNTYGIARAYYGSTLCLRPLNRLTEANTSINKSIETLVDTEHKALLARSYHQLALIKDELTEYEEALDALSKKMELAEELNDIRLQATTRSFMGMIHRKHGSFDLAEVTYQMLITLWDSLDNPDQTSRAFTDLAAVYIDWGKFELALKSTLQSKDICEKFNFKLTLASNFNNLGIIAKANNNTQRAINYFLKCVLIKEELNDNSQLFVNYYNLGNSYKQLGLMDSSIYHYKKSLMLNQLHLALKMETFWNLSEVFLLIDLPDSARKYQQDYGILRDSTDQLLSESTRVKDNFQATIKEKEILSRDNQIQRVSLEKQNQMIYGLVIILFLIVGMGILYFRSYRIKQRSLLIEKETEIQKQKIEDLLKGHEIKLLDEREEERNRIARDLHDRLGGTLSVVKMHMKSVEDILTDDNSKSLESYKTANSLLDDACEEVRQVAHDLESGVLKNFGLLSALKSLMKTINSTGQLRLELVNFGFEDDQEPARLKSVIERNVYRIVQELTSNVLKHADAKEMSVQLLKKNDNLNVLVEDDGIGFDPLKIKKEGLGLRSIQSRIENLNGFINLDSGKGSGTTITIDIPIQ